MEQLVGLPQEMWATIFSFLDLTSYLRTARVSKAFKQITEENNKRQTINLSECRRRLDQALPYLLKIHKSCAKIYADNCYTLTNKNLHDICTQYSSTLKSLDLRSCKRITTLDPLAKMQVLEYLNLSECTAVDLKSAQSVAALPQTLSRISLDGLSLLDTNIISIIQRCTNLEFFSLEQTSIHNETLQAISQSCPKIAYLKLSWCSNVTSEGFASLSDCKELRVLEVEECYNFDDKSLNSIAKCCFQLEKLNLENCFRVTNAGMTAVIQNLRKVLFLNIRGCQISPATLEEFMLKNPNCKVVQ